MTTMSGVAIQNFGVGAMVGMKILYEYVDRYGSVLLRMQLAMYQNAMDPQMHTCWIHVQKLII